MELLTESFEFLKVIFSSFDIDGDGAPHLDELADFFLLYQRVHGLKLHIRML